MKFLSENLNKNTVTAAVSLDMAKAFDKPGMRAL